MLQKNFKKNIAKYLDNYSETEASNLQKYFPEKQYEHCIIIPAYNENSDFITRLIHSPPESSSLLIILVINQPEDVQETQVNQDLWDFLTQTYELINSSHIHTWLTTNNTIDLLLIDRFNKKIPQQQGVGLARKIGGDIACKLFLNGKLLSKWAHHTDADANIPKDYLSISQDIDSQKHSALVYPYQHTNSSDETLFKATKLYEQALEFYVTGLKQAGSPYAYHTLGSCIATTHMHYSACRGFPKKSGGEDFYLLNKLAKTGEILSLKKPLLKIESRTSERVPFGTGPAVQKIIQGSLTAEDYLYYHPQCFIELKSLIQAFSQLDCNTDTQLWLSQRSPAIQEALKLLNINTLFEHFKKQSLNSKQCLKHCHLWLDAFKTLKLIHKLEKNFPKQPLGKSLENIAP